MQLRRCVFASHPLQYDAKYQYAYGQMDDHRVKMPDEFFYTEEYYQEIVDHLICFLNQVPFTK
jgi:hypothetical protein